jgi:hypothetical protein
MMNLRTATSILALTLLMACGQGGHSERATSESLKTYDVSEEAPQAATEAVADAAAKTQEGSAGTPAPDVKIAAPQIAYSYIFGYELDEGRISEAQQAHVKMCDTLGVEKCRIVSMKRVAQQGQFSSASLALQIDAKLARNFGEKLDATITEKGGESASREINADDLSKEMVDTEARIKAKQALADRLMILLKNRSGKVGELVEAERAFAEAQEELDAARTWLRDMQQRVSMSKIDITYSSYTPVGGGLWQPIRSALASVGQTMGESVGAAVTFVVMVLPWIFLIWVSLWLMKRFGWIKQIRFPWPRRWRRQADEDASNPPAQV